MQRLTERVAVLTGAASGIGRALAGRLASEGMKLVLSDVESGPLEAAVAELEARGAEVVGVPTDVSVAAAVEALAEAAWSRFGAVHLVCPNAGVMQPLGPAWERPVADYEWVFGVNLWGPLHCVRSFVPRMLASGEPGHLVITGSMSGVTVVPGNAAYQMSKHGTVALAETLYHELDGTAVGVSVLCPGFVETGILTSERNRPTGLGAADAPPPRPIGGGWSGGVTEELKAVGVSAEEVAGEVVDAIRDSRFWILTHANARERVQSRIEPLLSGANPVLDPSVPGAKR